MEGGLGTRTESALLCPDEAKDVLSTRVKERREADL